MPKVGTERIYHKGSGKEIYCNIYFTVKSKIFHIQDFPQEIKDWYGAKLTRESNHTSKLYKGAITAASYDECVALGRKVYSDYYEQQISEVKIICYQLKCNYPRPEFFGHKDRRDLYHAPSLAIGIQYRVLYRITIGDENFLSSQPYEQARLPEEGVRLGAPLMEREDTNSGTYNNWEKIPYTEEAHEFFKTVKNGLLQMITRVNDFFGEDANHLLNSISSGRTLDGGKKIKLPEVDKDKIEKFSKK